MKRQAWTHGPARNTSLTPDTYRQIFAEMPPDKTVTAKELADLFEHFAPLFDSKEQEEEFKKKLKDLYLDKFL